MALLPPIAKVESGPDSYSWLKDTRRQSSTVISYLEAENSYTEKIMEDTADLQDQLYLELKSRLRENDQEVPEKIDQYYYYRRSVEGLQYPIYCRRPGSMDQPEEILLDLNELAKDQAYFQLGAFAVSPDHRLLAYSFDEDGSESFRLQILDLKSHQRLNESIENTHEVVWTNDSQQLVYSTLDAIKRPYRAYLHKIGRPIQEDKLIFEEKDEAFYLELSRSKDKTYLFFTLQSKITTEVWWLRANFSQPTPQLFRKRQPNIEYTLEHHNNFFYVVTNERALNFKLVKTATAPPYQTLEEIVPHNPTIRIEHVEMFKDFMAIYQRQNGLRALEIYDFQKHKRQLVVMPESLYALDAIPTEDFSRQQIRLSYSTLKTPKQIYDYDMGERKLTLLKSYDVPGSPTYRASDYRTERLMVKVADGTRVPVALVYRTDLDRSQPRPCYLYGYGAYGNSIEPQFSPNRITLLNRGFIVALAHIRGGGEYGKPWHDQGKLLSKRNSFSDFIACAEELLKLKYTSADKLVISGGSAGGLLMGAVTNLRPDLFHGVIAKVPFVDVINTMLDPKLPLTVTEYDEWGNPENKKYYDYIRSYSPYDNVETKNYPNMLVTAGLYDPRVAYWEPAKWVAKLRAKKRDNNLLLLKTDMNAGHAGVSGRYNYLKEIALEYAFILKVLKLNGGK